MGVVVSVATAVGAVFTVAAALAAAIDDLIRAIRSGPPGANPTYENIEDADRLQQEQEERERAAQAALEEADRLAREAELQAQAARQAQEDAENAMRAAQEEAERVSREADEARAAAQQQAEAQRAEAQRREQELREEAQRRETALREEAARTEQRADEETRRALDAQRAAEAAAMTAAAEVRSAQLAREEAERQLREGIQPVVMPSIEDLRRAKERIGYRDGLYHFAVAGIAGSGKSSLINAFRGLRNRDPGAAATGITETTLRISRFPDADRANPFVWYDIPGAGTLRVRDWMYFNEQGLYVFDAIIVLVDNRFTATDVAILRNCRLFNIPTYIVRSKADGHVRNEMKERGYDSEDEEQDASHVARLEREAREHLISATRQSVRQNLQGAELPDQRVYIVSNTTLLGAVKGTMSKKTGKKVIDEYELLKDFLSDAHSRRGPGAHPQPHASSSKREHGTSVSGTGSFRGSMFAS